jgi:uncharacterized protein
LINSESNWISSKILLKKSHIHGKGMVAIDDLSEGEVLLIWREGYTDKKGSEKALKEGKKVFQWADDIFSIDNGEMKDAYYVNHSCDSNTWLEDAHRLSAMRDIKMGEEISVDYALFDYEENNDGGWECQCGSSKCRGKVTGKDWKNEKLQKKYEGHFSPLLNEKIRQLETANN